MVLFCSWYVCRVQIGATWISAGVAGWEPVAQSVVKEEIKQHRRDLTVRILYG